MVDREDTLRDDAGEVSARLLAADRQISELRGTILAMAKITDATNSIAQEAQRQRDAMRAALQDIARLASTSDDYRDAALEAVEIAREALAAIGATVR